MNTNLPEIYENMPRKELYLANIAGQEGVPYPEYPVSRVEAYLDAIAEQTGVTKEQLTQILAALPNKADLLGGKVPLNQLPDFVVADVVKVETYADLPAQGDSGKVYFVENDPDSTKNGAYKWIGDGYFKYTNEQNYYNVSILDADYTMGELYNAVDDINTQGQHVLFDLHQFVGDAYVCLIHFMSGSKCIIFDMLNLKAYGIGQTYEDTDLVSEYIESAVLDLTKITHETWTFTLEDDTEITKEVVLMEA